MPGQARTPRITNESGESGPPPVPSSAGRERWVVATLGLNLWAVALFVPAWVAELRAPGRDLALLGSLLVPLGLGVALWERGRRAREAAGMLLLVGYPTALALGVGFASRMTLAEPHPPIALLLAVLALWAYGARVAGSFARRDRGTEGEVRSKPLAAVASAPDAERRRWARRAMLALGGAGALLIGVVAPTLGGGAALRQSWSAEAAPAAGVLSAVVAGAIGTLFAAAFLGSATRRKRRPVSRRRRQTRVALLMVVVLLPEPRMPR